MNDQQRAAMQMALEALELLACENQTMHLLWWQIEARKPLSVLREALAQHPMDYDQGFVDGVEEGLAMEEPQESEVEHYRAIKKRNAEVVALETAQPQGKWVDLTEDDISDTYAIWWRQKHVFGSFAHAVIAKFKEKNTPKVVLQDPVAWQHSCNVLCVDGLELWIDQCPHCGKPRTPPPVVPQGEPVAEVIDHKKAAMIHEDKPLPYGTKLYATPPVVPQGEPVAKVDANDEGIWADILPDRDVKVGQLLYAAPPSVEAMRIETLEKAAKVADTFHYKGREIAAAIRGMK